MEPQPGGTGMGASGLGCTGLTLVCLVYGGMGGGTEQVEGLQHADAQSPGTLLSHTNGA